MIETTAIALEPAHHDSLKGLLASTFADESRDLLDVEIARAMDPRVGLSLVTLVDGEAVAAVMARQPINDCRFVVYLAVADAWRRHGMARRLLDHLATLGPSRFAMLVDENNHAAQRLYAVGGLRCAPRTSGQGQALWTGSWRSNPPTERQGEPG